jgi:hypothetical protein
LSCFLVPLRAAPLRGGVGGLRRVGVALLLQLATVAQLALEDVRGRGLGVRRGRRRGLRRRGGWLLRRRRRRRLLRRLLLRRLLLRRRCRGMLCWHGHGGGGSNGGGGCRVDGLGITNELLDRRAVPTFAQQRVESALLFVCEHALSRL